jgi:hypothetical protein
MQYMKRIGVVFFVLGMGVQFAAGAHLFDSHAEWTRTCTSHSSHFCNDSDAHDQGPCSICVASSSYLIPNVSVSPEFYRINEPFVVVSHHLSLLTRECDCSSPRGPPAPLA